MERIAPVSAGSRRSSPIRMRRWSVPIALRDQVRPGELVSRAAAGLLEADAEGGEAALAPLGEQRDDQARVEPTRKEDADRHVGHHAALDGDPEPFEHCLLPLLLRARAAGRAAAELRAPVLGLVPAAVGLDGQQRRGRELAHTVQDRPRRRHHRVPGEVVVERHRVDGCVDPAAGEQGRQRGGEAQAVRSVREVERLDAEPVATEQGAAALGVDEAEREHARQPVDEAVTPAVPRL